MRIRESSRAILINENKEVLLYKFIQNSIIGDKAFWVFPGGGVDEGESYEEALIRELEEETGIDNIKSYSLVWKRDILLNGKKGEFISREFHYLVECDYSKVSINNFTANEKKTFMEKKWWSINELENTEESITIPDLHLHLLKLIKNECDFPINLYE